MCLRRELDVAATVVVVSNLLNLLYVVRARCTSKWEYFVSAKPLVFVCIGVTTSSARYAVSCHALQVAGGTSLLLHAALLATMHACCN
jgi:hypothetical protein